jgi:hypothetical protein
VEEIHRVIETRFPRASSLSGSGVPEA